jgi:hypothetical protein
VVGRIGCVTMMGDVVELWRWWGDMIVWWRWVGVGLMLPFAQ